MSKNSASDVGKWFNAVAGCVVVESEITGYSLLLTQISENFYSSGCIASAVIGGGGVFSWHQPFVAYSPFPLVMSIPNNFIMTRVLYTVKKVSDFPGGELFNYSRPGRVWLMWLVTSWMETGESQTFFCSVYILYCYVNNNYTQSQKVRSS